MIKGDLNKALEDRLNTFDEVVRKTALDLNARLVDETPVDTGRAQSNWINSINNPSNEKRDPLDNAAISADYTQQVQRYNRDDTIFIANNLPYIGALNNGSSQQQPSVGWVDSAVLAAQSNIKRAARQLFKQRGQS